MSEDVSVIAGNDEGLRCETCATPLTWSGRGRKPKFCPEHKPGRGGRPAPAKPAQAAARRSVAKILIVVTLIVAHRRLASVGVDDERLDNDLSMTDAEADAVAAPVARWALRSSVGARVIGPIVANDDLIDAAVAVWEYDRRTRRVIAALRKERANGTVGAAATNGSGERGGVLPPVAPAVW